MNQKLLKFVKRALRMIAWASVISAVANVIQCYFLWKGGK